MKIVMALALLCVAWVLVYGTPLRAEKPELGHHFGSAKRILPMTFAHFDHGQVGCLTCHHNYVDDTGNTQCMTCHLTDPSVLPLFEEQFHDLCRDCHAELAAKGEPSGPTRQCVACHLSDERP